MGSANNSLDVRKVDIEVVDCEVYRPVVTVLSAKVSALAANNTASDSVEMDISQSELVNLKSENPEHIERKTRKPEITESKTETPRRNKSIHQVSYRKPSRHARIIPKRNHL